MNFGTLQSISKESKPTTAVDDNDEFEFDMGTDDGVDMEFEPEEQTAGNIEDITDKLIDLKMQIEDILSYLGYDSEDSFDEFPDDEDMELDPATEFNDDELDLDDELGGLSDDETEEFPDGEEESFFDDGQMTGDESALDKSPEEDPDFQGNIRTVAGANLVYKRKGEDGNYEELWIYNVGNDIRQEMQIRRAILAGTDIVPTQTESDDGTQHAETYTLGNVQYLKITGLPN